MDHKSLRQLASRAADGDEEALEELNVKAIKITRPMPELIDTLYLKAEYAWAINTAATRNLGIIFLEGQCASTMHMIATMASERDIDLPHWVDERDVAEIMVSIIPESDDPRKEQERQDEQQQQRDQRLQEEQQDQERQLLRGQDQPQEKKGQEEEDKPEQKPYTDRSGNKHSKCDQYGYFGTHLEWHMSKKDNIDSAAAPRTIKKVDTTRSSAQYYQCYFEDCASLVTRMSQHIRKKKHRITDAQALKEAKLHFRVIPNLAEASSSSEKKKGGPEPKMPPPHKKARRVEPTTESSDSSDNESYHPSDDSDMDEESTDNGTLRDHLDGISFAASSWSEEEEEGEERSVVPPLSVPVRSMGRQP